MGKASTRRNEYCFDDDGDLGGQDTTESTARSPMAHEPPVRRQSVPSHPVAHPRPIAQRLSNNLATQHPVTDRPIAPAVHGRVFGAQGDSDLAHSPALAVGPVASRSSSLNHVTPPAAHPQSAISPFYLEFRGKRVTPTRHDVVSEEADKELLLNASEGRAPHYDSTGLSAEVVEFAKLKEENGDKEDTWARLAEMAGFPLGGFWFFGALLDVRTYNRGRKGATPRQFGAEKDARWGDGLREPIGNRVDHAAATLTWGTLTPEKPGDDCVAPEDCAQFTYEAYDSFPPCGESTKRAVGKSRPSTFSPGNPGYIPSFSSCFSAPGAVRRE